MRKTVIALVVAVLLVSSFPAIVFAAPPADRAAAQDCQSGQILVKFKAGASLSEMAQIHRQLGGRVKETISGIGVQAVTVPRGQEMAKAKAYSSDARVAYAEPDYVAQAVGTPDDPYLGLQWGLTKVGAAQAWDVTTGSPAINIAILDTGVDLDHSDLANKIVSEINLTNFGSADDVYGHGTHVAGIAAAITDNGIGVAGLGYSATIMDVKVLDDNGMGAYSWIVSGITWAADNGADIINMSLGGSFASSAMEDAVNYAWSKGVVVVAAAGNNGDSTPMYPAYYTNCIAVAATDASDALASFSNFGDWVDVAAPGVSIYSTLKDNGYGYMSGTSMASPYVAGLAALVFTTVSDTNGDGRLNDEVRSQIEATCDNIGVGGIGSGRINAYLAVQTGTVTGTATGIVTDSTSGMPIAGATVSDGVRVSVTDAGGQYVITSIPQGIYSLTASASGYSGSSQVISIAAEQTVTANLALQRLPALWVQSIDFQLTARNLYVRVRVVDKIGGAAGAKVAVQLTNGSQNWNLTATTDSLGIASFGVTKAPSSSYVASITVITLAGYTWDETQGVTSGSYVAKKGGGKK
jgi:thermitase